MMAYRSDHSKYSCPRGPALLLTRFPLCISLVSFTIVVYDSLISALWSLRSYAIATASRPLSCHAQVGDELVFVQFRLARIQDQLCPCTHSFTATPHCRLGTEHRPELQFSHRNFATSCLNDTHCTHGSYVSSIADTPGKLVVWIAFYWTNSRGAMS